MANRLKSLELNGYKTFASKSSFEFSGDITVIVGPNGSGKSNIADALRWVLGEQSFRLLRGKRTDDMIFAGSQTRPRAGMASATVTFDNGDGWLPIDFSEVSITRRAYRDGSNEYLINGQRVRLRDVNELLSSSGLAERTYTVIGQGLVDAALTLKAEERRRLFEEAAGIGLYRSRKEQSLRRLENTRRNLERVEDILSELTPRLRSLRRQARRAEEYEQVRADLQEVLREWYGYHWHKALKDLQQVRDEVSVHEKNLEVARSGQEEAERSLVGLRDRINSLRSQLNSWHRQLSQIHSRREETSLELAVSDERRRALLEQEARTRQEIVRLEEERTRQQSRLEGFQQRVEEARQTASLAETELTSARQALETRRAERQAIEESIRSAYEQISLLTGRRAELAARRQELDDRIGRLQVELATQADRLQSIQETRDSHQVRIDELEILRAEHATRWQTLREQVETLQTELTAARQERQSTEQEVSRLEGLRGRYLAERSVLEEAEADLSGYVSGAKVLLEAARSGRLSKDSSAFGSQLQVPEEIEVAVSAALGEYVEAVLLGGEVDTENALDLLSGQSARAALLPLSDLSPLKPISAPRLNGCLGVASDLVDAAPALRPAVDLLLGQVLIVRDRQTARQALRGQDNHLRAVTLSGEIFFGSGAIMVESGKRSATLSRPRERRSLDERISGLENDLKTAHRNLEKIETNESGILTKLEEQRQQSTAAEADHRQSEEAHRQANLELEQSHSELKWLIRQENQLKQSLEEARTAINEMQTGSQQVEADLTALQTELASQNASLGNLSVEEEVAQVSYWEAQTAVGQQTLHNAEQIYNERKQADDEISARLQENMARAGSIKAQLVELDYSVDQMRTSEGGIGGEIAKLNQLIEPAEAELAALEAQQEADLNQEGSARQKTSVAERYYNQAQIILARRQEAMDTLRQRIETDFGLVEFEYTSDVPGPAPLPFGDVVQRLPVIEQVPEDLEDILKQQRMQLRRLGAVNPDAQREFREVSERHEFLTAQVSDLKHAEADIKEVIAELDILMVRDFKKTFEEVAVEFKQVFTRLFAGGSARLVMTEADDLENTGIDIEARLPGKRAQELALLSGGERSLTAAALVFALIKASPTPFCVMDEVDAMLDEANVGRFRQVLEELSKDTQFVVITHNRHTVQAADVIYGITMGRDTTSQTISLKLEEVDERYSSN